MKNWVLLLLPGILLILQCRKPGPPPGLAAILEEAQQQYCPDRRVCIWEMEVTGSAPWTIKGKTNLPEAKAFLLSLLSEQGLQIVDSIRLLPGEELKEKHVGLIALSVGNIRSEPRHSSELSTQATMGTPLNVYEQQGEWYRVQTPDQYIGWIDQGGLALMTDTELQNWRKSEKLIITKEFSSATASPEASSPSISDLVMGDVLEKLGKTGAWYRVAFPDGRTGYVSSEMASPLDEWLETTTPNAEELLSTARTLLGRPYLWGGTSVKGMDCSGFTKTVFFQHGMLLPRDASQQVQVGAHIDTDSAFSQLKPADLLFFGRNASGDLPEKITHVAIYLGNGEFIHASGQVRIESLFPGAPNYSDYRRSTFVRAKRLLLPSLPDNLLLNQNKVYF